MPTTLDAAFFPHIIDSILELAPIDCLRHLRICRDWKRRVDTRLYHFTLLEEHAETQFPMTTTYILEGSDDGDEAVFKTSWYRNCEPPPPDYLSAAKVIDIYAPTFKPDIVRILASASPKVTYRFQEQCKLWNTASWKPHCLVIFAHDMEADPTVSSYTQYGLRAVLGCDKLVLHVRESGHETLALNASTQLRNFKRLTIVMHALSCSHSHIFGPPSIEYLGLLIDLGLLGYASNVITTFVMCEPKWQFHQPWTEVDVQILRNRIIERKADLISRGHALSRGKLAPPPRFVTEAEYRAEVGEEQFKIEFNDGPERLLPPSHW